jgi:hypothetical protein
LTRGSCFNVYAPFSENKLSLVSYYANSPGVMIATIDIDELFKLATSDSNLINLSDTLKAIRFRVKYNLLDDLDYFMFPRRYVNLKHMIDNEDIFDDKYYRREKKILI